MDKLLQRKDVLLIFTYAPAGLGHLRVMNALLDGLPKDIDYVVLGADDTRITYWHRIVSIHPFIREFIEKIQAGRFRFLFYQGYISLLRSHINVIYTQLKNIILSQRNEKKTIVIISTHFGLAHQIAAIKKNLEKDLKVNIVLIDQITDATSMEILYIPEADLIFVPSQEVKTDLLRYAHKYHLHETNITVSPYPLSPSLSQPLSEKEYESKLKQYVYTSNVKINIAIPISGAAVGLNYYEKLIAALRKSIDRSEIFVVVKDYVYTWGFIKKIKRRHHVEVIEDKTDRKVVIDYDKLYRDEIIGLEIVKPSEQSFKTLFSSNKRGGPILLLTEPIGKQEHDNIDFLLDHHLIPDEDEQAKLERYALENITPSEAECGTCLKLARNWKAIRLTNDPVKDTQIIIWCLRVGVFSVMASSTEIAKGLNSELSPNGVKLFWQKIEEIIS